MARFTSTVSSNGGTPDQPDYIYYNAELVNNETSDDSYNFANDPEIRFNETRDTALVKDASEYHYSIVRFAMNGASANLPLFIPIVETGQANPDLTTYSCAIGYQQTWLTTAGLIPFTITPAPTPLIYVPETQNQVVAPIPTPPLVVQDIRTAYYWVYTIQHWVDLVNATLLLAHQQTYTDFAIAWAAATADAFPYPTFASFQAAVNTPQMVYDASTKRFRIYGDSDGFGTRITTFTPAGAPVGATTAPEFRLFFNTNLFNLFLNFDNTYWNTVSPTNGPYPGTAVNVAYAYELLFPNKFFQNVQDYRLSPYSGVAPLGYVPIAQQKPYWVAEQDWLSTSQFWTPISSIVFTSTLLPIRAESTGPPFILGTGTLGNSAAVAASAFEPIITDIAADLSSDGAEAYKKQIYYAPTAEYRMADFGPSHQEIRSIDIRVFWKSSLNTQLSHIQIPNLGSVSLKLMLRHKSAR